ncbi:hypothetical protein DRN39_04085 [Thermococci archaeon]|nr:MAG: hypothetical protein DRN39_04085 [Thermococci archaeon]
MGALIIIAPCLISPFYVYRGPKEKEYKTSEALLNLLSEYSDRIKLFTYPCPEYELIGWPRPPMSKEVFMRLGMSERAKTISEFIGRVIAEEKPEKIVFIGVKGSPTCGVFHTTSSDPDKFDHSFLKEFHRLTKEERIAHYTEILKRSGFRIVKGEGILFEILKTKFSGAVYVEFDKDNIEESLKRLKGVLEGL